MFTPPLPDTDAAAASEGQEVLRAGVGYLYSSDVDILDIHIQPSSLRIVDSDEFHASCLLHNGADRSIVSIELSDASELMQCHFLAFPGTVDGLPPFHPWRRRITDEEFIYFSQPGSGGGGIIQVSSTDDARVSILKSPQGRWVGLLVHEASKNLGGS